MPIFVRPREGTAIWRPELKPPRLMRPEGERIALTPFYLRRINDGDLIVVQQASAAPEPETETIAAPEGAEKDAD